MCCYWDIEVTFNDCNSLNCCTYYKGLVVIKPVFGVSDKVRFKPVSFATEISQKIEISLVPSLDIVLSNKLITKALIRLCRCAGWSAPLLFANPRRQVFSRRGPYYKKLNVLQIYGLTASDIWADLIFNLKFIAAFIKLFVFSMS